MLHAGTLPAVVAHACQPLPALDPVPLDPADAGAPVGGLAPGTSRAGTGTSARRAPPGAAAPNASGWTSSVEPRLGRGDARALRSAHRRRSARSARTVSISSSSLVALHVADAVAGHLRHADGVRVRAVVEMQSAPHPVDRPPVAGAPGVIALTRAVRARSRSSPTQDRAAHPARDLIAGRLPPRVGDPVGLPHEIQLELDRLPVLAPQRRRVVLVGLRPARPAEPRSAAAAPRRRWLGAQAGQSRSSARRPRARAAERPRRRASPMGAPARRRRPCRGRRPDSAVVRAARRRRACRRR